MPAFESSVDVAADPEMLFWLSQDYGRRLEWDPFLKEARLLGGAERAAIGAKSWCVAWHGMGMETEYIALNPPRVAAVKMTRGPRLLEFFAGAWIFTPIGDGVTRVRFRYNLRVAGGVFARLAEPAIAAIFRRDTRRRLAAFKAAAEKSATSV